MDATAWLQRGEPLLVMLFAAAATLWIGTLFSVSWLSGRAATMADGPEIGALALSLLRRWSAPSLLVCLVSGLAWVGAAPEQRAHDPWVYAAGVSLAALMLLHQAVGFRAKRVVRGSVSAARGEGVRRLAVILSMGALVGLLGLRGAFLHGTVFR
jgi:hypothetical protein